MRECGSTTVFAIPVPFSSFSKEAHSGGESEHLLLLERAGSPSAQLDLLDLELISSEEQGRRQPSGELANKADQMPHGEQRREGRREEPGKGKRKQKRVSYSTEEKEKEFQPKASTPKDSLVSTTTEDILFQKDDSASVYPLVSVTGFVSAPVL